METLKITANLSSNLDNTDKLIRENKALKQKVDALEKENMSLKKSIYDLSVKFSSSLQQRATGPFVIDLEESEVVPQDSGGGKEINLEKSTSGG